jgi:hypothetical protein
MSKERLFWLGRMLIICEIAFLTLPICKSDKEGASPGFGIVYLTTK